MICLALSCRVPLQTARHVGFSSFHLFSFFSFFPILAVSFFPFFSFGSFGFLQTFFSFFFAPFRFFSFLLALPSQRVPNRSPWRRCGQPGCPVCPWPGRKTKSWPRCPPWARHGRCHKLGLGSLLDRGTPPPACTLPNAVGELNPSCHARATVAYQIGGNDCVCSPQPGASKSGPSPLGVRGEEQKTKRMPAGINSFIKTLRRVKLHEKAPDR